MTPSKKPGLIHLEKIIAGKNPALLKLLPGFVLRYMKRIVHQDDLNDFLHRTKDLRGHNFVDATIEDFRIRLSSTGLYNIPREGGCIIVCNHPLGGIDGIALLKEVAKVRKDIKALANDLLMNVENLRDLFIPINKHGKNPTEVIRLLHQAYASGECVIVFPAGLVSRLQNWEIKDLEWSKGFISQSVRYRRNIIPVHVEGRNSRFFYGLGYLRKKLGIKANLEMFYLVDEVYRQKGKSIRLTIGEAIPYTTFTNQHPEEYWAAMVKEHVYGLEHGLHLLKGVPARVLLTVLKP